MDVRGIHGNRSIDPPPDSGSRPTRGSKTRDAAVVSSRQDSVAISDTGRETLAAVDQLTERARRDDPTRQERVEAAKRRLASGELDSVATLRDTARKMLGES